MEVKKKDSEAKKAEVKEKHRQAFHEKFIASAMKNKRLTSREVLNKIRDHLIAKKRNTKYLIPDALRKRIARKKCDTIEVNEEMHVFLPKQEKSQDNILLKQNITMKML